MHEPEVENRALGQREEDSVLESDCLSSVMDEAGHCNDSGNVDSVEELKDLRGQAAADDGFDDRVGPIRDRALDFEV
jgi:hypothetical protein